MLRKEDVKPDIPQFAFYVDAFYELNTDRPTGFGVAAIPFTSIMNYARIYDVEDTEEFIYLIRQMDNKFLELNNKKESSGGNKTSKSSKNSS